MEYIARSRRHAGTTARCPLVASCCARWGAKRCHGSFMGLYRPPPRGVNRLAVEKGIQNHAKKRPQSSKESRFDKRRAAASQPWDRIARSSDNRPRAGSNSKPDGRAAMGQVHGLDIVSRIYLAPGQKPSMGTAK